VLLVRGTDEKQASMFSLISPEKRVPADHPLRRIKRLVDEILADLSLTFDAMYSATGRPSIPPEPAAEGAGPDGAVHDP
jgi:hypothetical protein